MNTKSTKVTNQKQFRIMVDFMKKNPDIAKNNPQRDPEILQDLWNNLKKELNSSGPPIKEISLWKKVWCDYKSYLRKKLRHEKNVKKINFNKNIKYSSLEEEVIELMSLREFELINDAKSIEVEDSTSFLEPYEISDNGIGETSAVTDEEVLNDKNHDPISIADSENDGTINLEAMTRPKRKCQSFLEDGEDYQQELQSVSSSISHQSIHSKKNYYSTKMYRIMEKLNDQDKIRKQILQGQLNENIRHNRCMEKLTIEKNKIKAKLIEIELAKLKKGRYD